MNGARFVHDQLELRGWQVEIADALRVKGLAPLACKTDRIDAVSLPTPRFVIFVVEREELAREADLSTLAKALDSDPSRALAASLEVIVDRLTRPRVYQALGLEATPSGRDTLVAVPRRPRVTT